jgi:hypothetical protein
MVIKPAESLDPVSSLLSAPSRIIANRGDLGDTEFEKLDLCVKKAAQSSRPEEREEWHLPPKS